MWPIVGVGTRPENFGTLPAYILAIGTEYTVSSTTRVPTVFQRIKIDKYNCSYKKMNMITNLRPHWSELGRHLTQNPSSRSKLRPSGRAPTTLSIGTAAPSPLPGRAQSSGLRGVIFAIYLAPTALLRIFSTVLPYSIHGCNNSQFLRCQIRVRSFKEKVARWEKRD